jgi:phospholipase/lecithinase/hemolysin
MKILATVVFLRLSVVVFGFVLSSAANAASTTFSNLYAFGDSLSDSGNAYIVTGGVFPPSPPYAQRLSNGPVAVEWLAADLGITRFGPSVAGGTNYAVGGAATDTRNSSGLAIAQNTGIQSQVTLFASTRPAFDPATSLFFVWGGTNDFIIAANTGADLSATAAQAVVNLTSDITQLANAGAQHFFVPNLPDLGLTVFGRSTDPVGLSRLSQGFNASLASALAGLEANRALDITEFDVFSSLHRLVANPGAFGLTNVTDACFNDVTVCVNPDQFLFWDTLHPTARVHRILGEEFYAALVPEPAPIILFGIGLVALLVRQRRSQSGSRAGVA